MRTRRTLRRALLLAAAATAVAAGPAAASSIVYVKAGNLWLTSPDGSKGYQVTRDGGYSSPSQADNGIIGAIRNGRLVRMNRSGRLLNKPIDAMGSPGQDQHVAGPYDARISPDGRRFAYWFFITSSYYDPGDYREHADSESTTAISLGRPLHRPEHPDRVRQGLHPGRVADQRPPARHGRLLDEHVDLEDRHRPRLHDGAAQFWFGLQDPPDQYGVPAYHWYDDPALSPDGTKLAMTDGPVGHRQPAVLRRHARPGLGRRAALRQRPRLRPLAARPAHAGVQRRLRLGRQPELGAGQQHARVRRKRRRARHVRPRRLRVRAGDRPPARPRRHRARVRPRRRRHGAEAWRPDAHLPRAADPARPPPVAPALQRQRARAASA